MVRALTAELEARALATPPVWDPYLDAELSLGAPGAEGARELALVLEDIGFSAEDDVLLDLEALAPLAEDVAAYGRALGEALWTEAMAGHLRHLLDEARERGVGVRLWLRLTDPALEPLAWERLHYPLADGAWQPLATSQMILLCRRLAPPSGSGWAPEPLAEARALLLMCAPSDLPPIPEDQLRETEAAMAGFSQLTVLSSLGETRPTREALTEALQGGVQVLHVLAHGQGWPAAPRIFLEDEDGLVAPLFLEELLELLNSLAAPPRLCFFAACESAQASPDGTRLSLGAAIVRGSGVHSAAAMTGLVGVRGAVDFTRAFYERLELHGLVDLALQEARAQLRGDKDWSAPVLFSHVRSTRLLARSAQELEEGLAWMGRGFRLMAELSMASDFAPVTRELLTALEALLDELERAQRVVAEWLQRLARCGMDPAQFELAFRELHVELSLFAATEGFSEARRRAQRIHELGLQVRPLVEELLGPEAVAELDAVMLPVAESHGAFMGFLPRFIEEMAEVADRMMARLDAGDADGAIAEGRAFTLRAGQSLRANLRLYRRMQEQVDMAGPEPDPEA